MRRQIQRLANATTRISLRAKTRRRSRRKMQDKSANAHVTRIIKISELPQILFFPGATRHFIQAFSDGGRKKCPACEMASPRRRFFLLLGTFLPKAKLSLLVGIDRLNKSDVTSCLLDGEKLSPSFIIRLFVAPTFFFFCCFGCKCVMSGLFTHVCQLEKIHE